jgi:NADPH:quinone reductase-like Zn-dependent oxidoreductase
MVGLVRAARFEIGGMTMKAAVYGRYGPPDVIEVRDVEKPVPGDDDVLIAIRAASVNTLDWRLTRGSPRFLRLMIGWHRPKDTRLGRDVAGRVESVGRNVTRFKPGDEVFGVCAGAFAEYACAREGKLAIKPAGVSFEAAAALPVAASTALQGLRDRGRLRQGDRVAVEGASGGVGTFAVQLARALGAEVTAVCSPRNAESAASMGAAHVVDYTREDFTRSGRRYDLILGANAHHSIFDYRRALSENGRFVLCGGGGIPMTQAVILGPLLSRMGSRKVGAVMAKIDEKELAFLAQLVAEGKVVPVIERTYPLTGVPDAVRYLEQGHARGKLVITLDGEAAQT